MCLGCWNHFCSSPNMSPPDSVKFSHCLFSTLYSWHFLNIRINIISNSVSCRHFLHISGYKKLSQQMHHSIFPDPTVFSRPSKAEVLSTITFTDWLSNRGESHITYRPVKQLHESEVFINPSPEPEVLIMGQNWLYCTGWHYAGAKWRNLSFHFEGH